jgi:hypothetical protein
VRAVHGPGYEVGDRIIRIRWSLFAMDCHDKTPFESPWSFGISAAGR